MHGSLRPTPALLIALLAFLASLGGLAGNAFGAVAAHQLVVQGTAPNSVSPKSAPATCPTGKKLVGGGGSKTFGADGEVVLGAIRPNPTLTSMTVSGLEDENGFAGNWTVTADAICATAPPGLQRVAATSATNSSNKSVTGACPSGKKVLGAAGEITAGGGQVSMVAIRPNPTLTAVTVIGAEDGTGFAGNWSVTAYAICATPPAGLQRVTATSPPDSQPDKFIPATCPAGKGVIGAGAEIANGSGQVIIGELIPGPSSNPDRVFAAGFEDENGFAGNWTVTSYAICAAVSSRVTEVSSFDSASPKFGLNQCPSGKSLTGYGGEVAGGAGQVMLDVVSSFAPIPLTAGGAAASEDETGFGGNWLVRGYAICATPLPGLEHVSASSPSNSGDKMATASCPPGKRVVGAGGEISGGAGQVVLDGVIPDASLASVTVTGLEDATLFTGNWSVTAHAICATPPPGLQRVRVATPEDIDPPGATATCPAGQNLLGGGANLEGAPGRAVLDDMRPDALLRSLTATGLAGENGVLGSWRVDAFAICANP